jgi:hypothetical protein
MDPDVWFDIPVQTAVGGAVGCATLVGYLMGIGIIILPILAGCGILLALCGLLGV